MLSGNLHFSIYSPWRLSNCKHKMIMHTPELNALHAHGAGACCWCWPAATCYCLRTRLTLSESLAFIPGDQSWVNNHPPPVWNSYCIPEGKLEVKCTRSPCPLYWRGLDLISCSFCGGGVVAKQKPGEIQWPPWRMLFLASVMGNCSTLATLQPPEKTKGLWKCNVQHMGEKSSFSSS